MMQGRQLLITMLTPQACLHPYAYQDLLSIFISIGHLTARWPHVKSRAISKSGKP